MSLAPGREAAPPLRRDGWAILALAAGGIPATLADTMFPEAFQTGGPWVALAATAGFAAAFLLAELAH